MFKKSITLGLTLLLAGSAVLGWVLAEKKKEQHEMAFYKSKYASGIDEYLKQYNEWLQLAPEKRTRLPWGPDKYGKTKTEAQLRQEQQERLKADLDKLAAGETDIYPFADILYGENWQEELGKYKKQKELKEFVFTCSIVCTFTGGMILSWYLLSRMARLIIGVLSHLKKLITNASRYHSKTKNEQRNNKQKQRPNKQKSELQKQLKASVNSGWQNSDKGCEERHNLNTSQTAPCMKDSSPLNRLIKKAEKKFKSDSATLRPREIATLLSTANSEKQMMELKQMSEPSFYESFQNAKRSQSAQQTMLEHSEPINNTLRELTQQVSAIREYASQQQDRVKKLEDGYDWNIIRTFCLRIIRCIDNIESCISWLSDEFEDVFCNNPQNRDTVAYLKEVRDELIFALESSGVEQFEPAVNSDYHGLEKRAEAVKEKEHSDDPNLKGKIAKVIRPGYQYFIDEENIKIVRTAEVKLFS
jgi:molecular chaperone GrpE (heat shock protein)